MNFSASSSAAVTGDSSSLRRGHDLVGVMAQDDRARVIGDLGQRAQHRRGGMGMNIVGHSAPRSSVEVIFTIP